MAPPPPASGRDNLIGIVLVAGAVLVGLLLLVKGYDSEGGVIAADSTDTTESTTTTTPPESTTTTVATTPPAQVVLKVANASGATGAASKTRTSLQDKGYSQISILDAPSVVPSTEVLYVEGHQGDAQAVATALGLEGSAVQPMPSPPPVTLGDATVVVLVGPDLT
jgi:hypothetical protein